MTDFNYAQAREWFERGEVLDAADLDSLCAALLADLQRLEARIGQERMHTAEWADRALKAEAELQRLEEALELIAENAESWELPPRGIIAIGKISRTALAAVRKEPQP